MPVAAPDSAQSDQYRHRRVRHQPPEMPLSNRRRRRPGARRLIAERPFVGRLTRPEAGPAARRRGGGPLWDKTGRLGNWRSPIRQRGIVATTGAATARDHIHRRGRSRRPSSPSALSSPSVQWFAGAGLRPDLTVAVQVTCSSAALAGRRQRPSNSAPLDGQRHVVDIALHARRCLQCHGHGADHAGGAAADDHPLGGHRARHAALLADDDRRRPRRPRPHRQPAAFRG